MAMMRCDIRHFLRIWQHCKPKCLRFGLGVIDGNTVKKGGKIEQRHPISTVSDEGVTKNVQNVKYSNNPKNMSDFSDVALLELGFKTKKMIAPK